MPLKTLFAYLWGPREEDSLEDAFETLRIPEPPPENPEKAEKIADKCLIKKTGAITYKKGNFHKIDDEYEYITEEELAVGAEITYTVYRDGYRKKITNVKPVVDEWSQTIPEGEMKWFNQTIVGQVISRVGRIIHVHPGNVQINLNTVSTEFIPKTGDWIQMDVKSELDVQVLNFSGSTLEIMKISPLRTKIIRSVVQGYNEITHNGHLSTEVYFDRDSLAEGFMPRKGDRVVAEVIESTQGVYTWRAVKIVLQNLTQESVRLTELELPKLLSYENDVDGIEITDGISLSTRNFNDNVTFSISVCNRTGGVVALKDIKFDSRVSQLKLLSHGFDKDCVIADGVTEEFKFVLNAKSMGDTVETVVFMFEGYNIGRSVRINLTSRVANGNRRYHKTASDNVSLMRSVRSKTGGDLIPGQRIANTYRFSAKPMAEFKVPESLWNTFLQYEQSQFKNGKLYRDIYTGIACLKGNLTYPVYEERFHTLLHMDEIEVTVAMRKYDRDCICFIPNQDYLMMEVENLSEMRPSIIIGDHIIATSPVNPKRRYQGFVHKVTARHLYLKFSPLLHETYGGEDYSVHAVQSRMTARKQHQAVRLAVSNLGRDFLFPTQITKKPPQTTFNFDRYDDTLADVDKKITDRTPVVRRTNKEVLQAIKDNLALSSNNSLKLSSDPVRLKLEWHDKSLNYYQKEAVRNVLLGEARPLPYIIFGPPGTGKTVTVVESIVQILKMVPGARLLVATPSNSAADIIALRLIELVGMKPGEMVRFVSYKYAADDLIPGKLLPYSATGSPSRPGASNDEVLCENGLKMGCSSATLGRHLVTVGTCGAIGNLHNMGFPKGHFTHIIIDEAGQCTEPEILIPLTFLDVNQGQAILSGDPMQLGPVIVSKFACALGLGESFLERMLNRFPYIRDVEGFPKTGGYDPRLVTCLVYNYRSLPGIVHLPNTLFYHSELRPTLNETSAEYKILDSIKEILPAGNESSPPSLIFHGLNSENYQEEDSPSWFNPDEASQVFYYLNELYRLGLKSTDVGIISPYIKQVKHIREILREAGFEVPKIGTIEEFQGSEFRVIILSTVRSNKDLIGGDLAQCLGFISNPKRLNVALTRAQCLCVIVGNPSLLKHDPHWRAVLVHCVTNGAYAGCEFNEDLLD